MAGQPVLEPGFIDGASGRLLLMRWAPAHIQPRGEVLIVPPFGEEMNRTRRQLALAGQVFAAQGLGTSLLDLSGTGDSDGTFADATIDLWRDDIRRAIRALAGRGKAPLTVLGLRLGTLLALDAVTWIDRPPQNVVLWQPVASG